MAWCAGREIEVPAWVKGGARALGQLLQARGILDFRVMQPADVLSWAGRIPDAWPAGMKATLDLAVLGLAAADVAARGPHSRRRARRTRPPASRSGWATSMSTGRGRSRPARAAGRRCRRGQGRRLPVRGVLLGTAPEGKGSGGERPGRPPPADLLADGRATPGRWLHRGAARLPVALPPRRRGQRHLAFEPRQQLQPDWPANDKLGYDFSVRDSGSSVARRDLVRARSSSR